MDRKNTLLLALICHIVAASGGQFSPASLTQAPPSTATTPVLAKAPVSSPETLPVASPPTVSAPAPANTPDTSPPAPVPAGESPLVEEPTAAPIEAPTAEAPAPAHKKRKTKRKKHRASSPAPAPAPEPAMMGPPAPPGQAPESDDYLSPGPSDDAVADESGSVKLKGVEMMVGSLVLGFTVFFSWL